MSSSEESALERRCAELEIHVDVRSFDDVPDVLVMKALISQAFSNLIENAIKYSARETTIGISGRHLDHDDVVEVTVANEGISIAPEDAERIFERGARTQAASDIYPAGTGFGLYIARKIVEIHEGAI